MPRNKPREAGSAHSHQDVTRKPDQGAAMRLRAMHEDLLEAYGPQHWWPGKTRIEKIVGAYLTQNTAWTAVERSLGNLRGAGALSVDGLRAISPARLMKLIRPSGFSTRKAPALKAFVTLLDRAFGGSLRKMAAAPTAELRELLLDLPGVGPETADAILLYALGHAVPVSDEYLRRIVERHGLAAPADGRRTVGYADLADLTVKAFAGDAETERVQMYNEFHALVVAVGKRHCGRTARCEGCPLEKWLAVDGKRRRGAGASRKLDAL